MKKDELSPREILRIENELKALNLEIKYGARSEISNDLPPEVVKHWLENVEKIEACHQQMNLITILEFIGNPDYRTLETLMPEEIEPEIDRLLNIMAQKCVLLKRPENRTPSDFYKMITEDFFFLEIPNLQIPGMVHFFTSE